MNNTLDTATLLKMLDEAGKPFLAKLEKIEDKLSTHATKDDVGKLRGEFLALVDKLDAKITNNYVPRDVYESRHSQLILRDTQLEESIRAMRQDHDRDMSTIRDTFKDAAIQLEAARHQGELRANSVEENVEKKLKEKVDADLSTKDRAWIRSTQIQSWIAIALALTGPFIAFILQHLQFHP